ncbi:hypothetical protein B0H19DRAFT_958570, partial [Mycena capillaripes]
MGGKDLLDLVARNEAIAITWLKTYLSFGPNRPLWCFVADELLATKAVLADQNVDEAMRINTYLQSWAPYQNSWELGSRDLADMMKIGRKYGITADAIAVSRKLQGDMLVWYHRFSGGDKRLFNAKEVVKCMKEKHRVRFVKDAVLLARKIGTARHKFRVDCKCSACRVTKAITGCRHPHLCFQKSRELLDSLEEKWDPRYMQPEDFEEYQTPTAEADSETAEFDSRVTTDGTLADIFRIFTENNSTGSNRAPDTRFVDNQGAEVEVYTDGSALNNGMPNATAGAGVYFGEDDARNRAIRIPSEMGPSNQVGEIIAIKEAVEAAPKDAPL